MMSWHLAMVRPQLARDTPLWFWTDHKPFKPQLACAKFDIDDQFVCWDYNSIRVTDWERRHPYYGRAKTR